MPESTVTKNQLEYIKKLRQNGVDRNNRVLEFLRDKGKEDLDELTMQEASELIDSLRNIKGPDSEKKEIIATGKQITFITNLQDTEERKKLVSSYLSDCKKVSVNNLTMTEASALIDKLMQLKGGARPESTDSLATKKQIQYIKNLQGTETKLKFTTTYLKELKKMSIEELTKKEASALIEKLKDIKK